MSAAVIPFPLSRRAFVEKQARVMARRSPEAAERYLRQQLDGQMAIMGRRGIPEPVIEREITAADRAIRAELCRILHSGEADGGSGGAA